MSLQAYQQTARAAEDPRTAEYRLLGEVSRALIAAADADADDLKTRIDALDWNRRVWSALAADCAGAENQLPELVRARIVSLSLWVSRHSSAVMRREAGFQPLIDVNRLVMQGLSGAPEPQIA